MDTRRLLVWESAQKAEPSEGMINAVARAFDNGADYDGLYVAAREAAAANTENAPIYGEPIRSIPIKQEMQMELERRQRLREKRRRMHEMKKSGLTYSEIGKHYAITASRTQKMLTMVEKDKEDERLETLFPGLCVETIKVILTTGARNREQVEEINRTGGFDNLKGCGPRRKAEIAAWLGLNANQQRRSKRT